MLLSILLSIIGFAILFIVLTNVVLFCLETKAVGIIISIIGILSFLSGGSYLRHYWYYRRYCLYNHAKELHEKEHRKSITNITKEQSMN